MAAQTIEVRAPFDGAPVGAAATASADAMERALATAHARERTQRGAGAPGCPRGRQATP